MAAVVLAVGTSSWVTSTPASAGGDLARQPEVGDRVLQSVAVTVGSDGTLTQVDGTTVTAAADGSSYDSVTESYAPDDVVSEIPVRVLTSYRTDEGTGTDLSDLAGYTGRVQVDLQVQNLTVEPQDLTYDYNGSSRTSPALVGVPLTITAAAVLDGTAPSAVVTPKGDEVGRSIATTNGVLSQSSEGTTQVQWATILAPPQLSASATLRLVIDATDFVPPVVDLSVQPGLVTDPSLGALVDTAFNPAASDERELQARTIELIGDVNGVLSRAGRSITKVRRTLESSSNELGTKTVSDLQGSVTKIAGSMKTLTGTVDDLGTDLSSALETAGASSIQQLTDSVTALHTLLGDTTAEIKPARLSGTGCQTTVRTTAAPRAVYSSLLRVATRLDGYATGTQACKTSLQQAILTSIGPIDPSEVTCTRPSVTCSLLDTKTTFSRIAEDLIADGESAIAALDPENVQAAVDAVDTLAARGNEAIRQLGLVELAATGNNLGDSIAGLLLQVIDIDDTYDDLGATIAGVHSVALAQLEVQDTMAEQNAALARELCQLIGEPVAGILPPGKLAVEEVERLRSYLVSTTCGDQPRGNRTDDAKPPMAELIASSREAWIDVRDMTATSNGGLGDALGDLFDDLDAVRVALQAAQALASNGSTGVDNALTDLTGAMDDLVDASETVAAATDVLDEQQDVVTAAVREAFNEAAEETSTKIAQSIDPEIRRVTTQAAVDSASLGRSLDQSAAGLRANAEQIVADGKATIDAEKERLAQRGETGADNITRVVDQGLRTVSTGVSASNRDTQAAGRLLTADLNKVLADLGNPRVRGTGLLGSLATNAATAGTADYQLSLATDTANAYANVRGRDVGELLLRQAQSSAALERQRDWAPFQLELPSGVEHRTLYLFHLGG